MTTAWQSLHPYPGDFDAAFGIPFIVLRDGRIAQRLPPGSAAPAGAMLIDATGCTVLPGLIDLHTHVSVPGGSYQLAAAVSPSDNLTSQLD